METGRIFFLKTTKLSEHVQYLRRYHLAQDFTIAPHLHNTNHKFTKERNINNTPHKTLSD